MSAGWVWHPWNAVVVFDIARAVEDPEHLASDGCCKHPLNPEGEEDASATWLTADRLVSTTTLRGRSESPPWSWSDRQGR